MAFGPHCFLAGWPRFEGAKLGLLTLHTCWSNSPSGHHFEEALFFRVSFLPLTKRLAFRMTSPGQKRQKEEEDTIALLIRLGWTQLQWPLRKSGSIYKQAQPGWQNSTENFYALPNTLCVNSSFISFIGGDPPNCFANVLFQFCNCLARITFSILWLSPRIILNVSAELVYF